MRPISLAVRSVATLALALGAAACDDVPTQSGATEVRGPRMSVSDARAPQLLVCPTQDATNSRAVAAAALKRMQAGKLGGFVVEAGPR